MNRFGIVALVGKPNVGKSTLLNALIGEELAIVSPKPQTTRVPTMGILTRDDPQILFKDAPGLLEPRYALQVALRHHALRVMREAHLVLHLHPLSDHPAPPLADAAGLDRPPRSPVLTVYSKADLMPAPRRPALASAEVAISAQSGEGLAPLLERCRQHLDEGPFAYDAESISLQPVRFFAAEYVREAAFAQLGQELPYSVHVEIDEFREGSDPLYIRATVYVERASQKGMVIGDRGRRIKVLGTAARTRIETLVGARVFLDLRVKVLPKWRRRASTLNALGYTP